MKKLNIALIILLLVFQTVMTPVSALASESEILTEAQEQAAPKNEGGDASEENSMVSTEQTSDLYHKETSESSPVDGKPDTSVKENSQPTVDGEQPETVTEE